MGVSRQVHGQVAKWTGRELGRNTGTSTGRQVIDYAGKGNKQVDKVDHVHRPAGPDGRIRMVCRLAG